MQDGRDVSRSLEVPMLAETICSAVSAAGLGIAAITAYRKRFLTATRILAYSLVPVGLVMTGQRPPRTHAECCGYLQRGSLRL